VVALGITIQFAPRSSALPRTIDAAPPLLESELQTNVLQGTSDTSMAAGNEGTSATVQQYTLNSDGLWLKVEADQSSVFVGSQLELKVQLFYTTNGIRNPQFSELLLPNSVTQEIDPPNQYEQRIDSVRYGVYEKRYVLTPQESGPLEIPDITFRGEVVENRVTREISAVAEGFTVNVVEGIIHN
ncbi:MAG: hypothetical protein MI746_12395, partial [Pseudomonadales bacterium]|nr:hypothetical protein [Pseudomonadales bacterium]